MKKLRYALIGCGRISVNHIEAARSNKLDFVAMCDIVPEVMPFTNFDFMYCLYSIVN